MAEEKKTTGRLIKLGDGMSHEAQYRMVEKLKTSSKGTIVRPDGTPIEQQKIMKTASSGIVEKLKGIIKK